MKLSVRRPSRFPWWVELSIGAVGALVGPILFVGFLVGNIPDMGVLMNVGGMGLMGYGIPLAAISLLNFYGYELTPGKGGALLVALATIPSTGWGLLSPGATFSLYLAVFFAFVGLLGLASAWLSISLLKRFTR